MTVAACLMAAAAASAATIGSLTPSQAKAGDAAFVLVVDGEGFTEGATGSRVLWNGFQRPTTWVSANRLTAAISAADVDEALTATVQVTTPGQGTSPTAAAFPVVNPRRTSTTSTRHARVRGSAGFVLTVKGAGFVRGSKVLWNGLERATTTSITPRSTATVRAERRRPRASQATVQVVSPPPTPDGALSTTQTFYVTNPVPTIASRRPGAGDDRRRQHDGDDHGDQLHAGDAASHWNGCSSS